MSQIAGNIESGLPTHSCEDGIGFLNLKNTFDDIWQQRFDVYSISHFWIVLNGSWIGIDQYNLVTIGAQGAAGL